MAEPKIAGNRSAKVRLAPGKYAWCACGQSQNQPFCDGSHKGTEFRPVPFEVETEQDMSLCMCKHTKNAPRCDGTHRQVCAQTPTQ